MFETSSGANGGGIDENERYAAAARTAPLPPGGTGHSKTRLFRRPLPAVGGVITPLAPYAASYRAACVAREDVTRKSKGWLFVATATVAVVVTFAAIASYRGESTVAGQTDTRDAH